MGVPLMAESYSTGDHAYQQYAQLRIRIEQQRYMVHAGVIHTWKALKQKRRTTAQQLEMDVMIELALYHLAECDRMEQSLKP